MISRKQLKNRLERELNEIVPDKPDEVRASVSLPVVQKQTSHSQKQQFKWAKVYKYALSAAAVVIITVLAVVLIPKTVKIGGVQNGPSDAEISQNALYASYQGGGTIVMTADSTAKVKTVQAEDEKGALILSGAGEDNILETEVDDAAAILTEADIRIGGAQSAGKIDVEVISKDGDASAVTTKTDEKIKAKTRSFGLNLSIEVNEITQDELAKKVDGQNADSTVGQLIAQVTKARGYFIEGVAKEFSKAENQVTDDDVSRVYLSLKIKDAVKTIIEKQDALKNSLILNENIEDTYGLDGWQATEQVKTVLSYDAQYLRVVAQFNQSIAYAAALFSKPDLTKAEVTVLAALYSAVDTQKLSRLADMVSPAEARFYEAVDSVKAFVAAISGLDDEIADITADEIDVATYTKNMEKAYAQKYTLLREQYFNRLYKF